MNELEQYCEKRHIFLPDMGRMMNELIQYCEKRHIFLPDLGSLLRDKKIDPHVQGGALECNIRRLLQKIRDRNPASNGVLGSITQGNSGHEDIRAILNGINKRIEVKLAKSFQETPNPKSRKPRIKGGFMTIPIKVHRSRRVSTDKVAAERAKKYHISKESVWLHADQYRAEDFDVLAFSLGFMLQGEEWIRNRHGKKMMPVREVLKILGLADPADAYYKIYLTRAQDVVSSQANPLCPRPECNKDCGFIPNFFMFSINLQTGKPKDEHVIPVPELHV